MFYEATFDLTDIKKIKDDIEQIQDKFGENFLKVGTQIEDDYLPLLQQEPSQRAVHTFVWSHDKAANDRARRKYFYLINSGQVNTDGYGYVRNGGYANSWRVEIDQNGTEYSISVFSTFPASKFVGGLRQVPGHEKTGWVKYQPILADIDTFMESIIVRLV